MDIPVAVHPLATLVEHRATFPARRRFRSAATYGEAVAQATRQLIARGHERILLVAIAQPDSARVDAELQGHYGVMLAAGLPLLPRLEFDIAAATLCSAVAGSLESAAPTALLCTRVAILPALETALRSHQRLSHLIVAGPEHSACALGATCH